MSSVINLYQTPFSMTKSSFQANPSGYTVAFNVYVGRIFWNYLWSTTHWCLWATIGHQLIVDCKKKVCAPRIGWGCCMFCLGMVQGENLNTSMEITIIMLHMEQKSTEGCGNCSYWSGCNDQFLLVVTVGHPSGAFFFPLVDWSTRGPPHLPHFSQAIGRWILWFSILKPVPFFSFYSRGHHWLTVIENTSHLGVFEAIPAVSALDDIPTVLGFLSRGQPTY